MKRTWPVLIPVIVLALLGACISYMLMAKHLAKSTGVAWFDSVCEGGLDSTASCDEVLASRYGVFPPVPPDLDAKEKNEPRSVWGLFEMKPRPVALFGLLYFITLAGWYLGIGRPGYEQRLLHLLPLLLNFAGVCGSLFFACVMFFTDLEAWCPWCLVTHVINGLLLVGAVLLWPRKLAADGTDVASSERTAPPDAPAATAPAGPVTADQLEARRSAASHPSCRLVLVTLAGIAALLGAEWYFFEYVAKRNQHAALDQAMTRFLNDTGALYSLYQSNEKHDIPIRADDPVKNDGAIRLPLIVFTDFECPHCKRFRTYLDENIYPLFEGKLKIVFKYFPTNKACNQRVKDIHPNACRAASAAEAARVLGGNDAFWSAHDRLFDSGDKLAGFGYRALASELGLDPDRFVATMESKAVQRRIREDIELAFRIGVNATPALYLSGRRVPKPLVRSPVFWQVIKTRLDRILTARQAKKARARQQAQTQPAATPGSQGP